MNTVPVYGVADDQPAARSPRAVRVLHVLLRRRLPHLMVLIGALTLLIGLSALDGVTRQGLPWALALIFSGFLVARRGLRLSGERLAPITFFWAGGR